MRLEDKQFAIAVALRLGASVCLPHECVCGAETGALGGHALVCGKLKGRHVRHRHANAVIQRAMAAAEMPTTLEPVGLCLTDDRRPYGQTLLPWSRGKPLVWDYTCVHRLAASYARRAVEPGPRVAEIGEEKKTRTYADLESRFIVQPVAMETLGGFGPDSMKFIAELGRRMTLITGEPRETVFLRQRLGIVTQMGNAVCVLESLPQVLTTDHDIN